LWYTESIYGDYGFFCYFCDFLYKHRLKISYYLDMPKTEPKIIKNKNSGSINGFLNIFLF
jgi:hypothetical protein